jgi:hypothetical protein
VKLLIALFLLAPFALAQTHSTGSGAELDANAEQLLDTEFDDDIEENPIEKDPAANTSNQVIEDFESEVESELSPTPTTLPPRKAVVSGDKVKSNRYPVVTERFVKPPRSASGGTVRVPHPDASKGLLRINSDNSYQYKVKLREKSKSASLRVGSMTAPKISGETAGVSYELMYGKTNLTGFNFEYEWQPFTKFGRIGLNLGFGLAMGKGRGYLASSLERSREEYSLYILPLSANLVYRFEYGKRQFLVPYILGGGSYYGMYENRDDNKKKHFAGSFAVGGGGGLLISLSKWDAKSAFTLSEEYGVADLWLSIEARALKGLKQDIDFTGQTLYVGITADY